MSGIKPVTTAAAVLGQVIEQARSSMGLTQREVAQTLEIGASGLSRIEKGQSSITVEQLKTVAKKLATAPGTLLEAAEEAERMLEKQGIEVVKSISLGEQMAQVIASNGAPEGTKASGVAVAGLIAGGPIGAVALPLVLPIVGASLASALVGFWGKRSEEEVKTPD